MSQEKSIKTFRENFGYYDRTGMQEYLEQKASEGWRLIKKQFASEWEFKRIEPQKIHYAITYLPQFSNEDSFLLSENKKEYLELCAESGWQFVCAYKNMVIFLNEEENPLPFETDPEAELALIHKSVLKHSLPKIIISLAILVGAIIGLLFSDFVSKSFDVIVGGLLVICFYIITDFCAYLRWRKKALAAAATGEFSRTDTPDKLIFVLFAAVTLLCAVIIIVKSVAANNWEALIKISVLAAAVILIFLFDKLKKKTDSNRKKHLIGFIWFLVYIALAALSNYFIEIF